MDSWDDYAKNWDQDPDVGRYSALVFEQLRAALDPSGLVVLDFGCGTGPLTERLAPAASQVVALDTSPKMIEVLKAKALPGVTTHCGPLGDLLPERAGQFDLIVASSACAFVPDFAGLLQQAVPLLKPGGRWVQWDWALKPGAEGVGFVPSELEGMLKEAGLVSVQLSQPFALSGPDGEMPVVQALASKGER